MSKNILERLGRGKESDSLNDSDRKKLSRDDSGRKSDSSQRSADRVAVMEKGSKSKDSNSGRRSISDDLPSSAVVDAAKEARRLRFANHAPEKSGTGSLVSSKKERSDSEFRSKQSTRSSSFDKHQENSGKDTNQNSREPSRASSSQNSTTSPTRKEEDISRFDERASSHSEDRSSHRRDSIADSSRRGSLKSEDSRDYIERRRKSQTEEPQADRRTESHQAVTESKPPQIVTPSKRRGSQTDDLDIIDWGDDELESATDLNAPAFAPLKSKPRTPSPAKRRSPEKEVKTDGMKEDKEHHAKREQDTRSKRSDSKREDADHQMKSDQDSRRHDTSSSHRRESDSSKNTKSSEFRPMNVTEDNSGLPYPWTKVIPERGTPYYYNSITRESAWDLPPGLLSNRGEKRYLPSPSQSNKRLREENPPPKQSSNSNESNDFQRANEQHQSRSTQNLTFRSGMPPPVNYLSRMTEIMPPTSPATMQQRADKFRERLHSLMNSSTKCPNSNVRNSGTWIDFDKTVRRGTVVHASKLSFSASV